MNNNNSKALAPETQAQQEQSININDLMAEIKALREHQAQLEAFASNAQAQLEQAQAHNAILSAQLEEKKDERWAQYDKKWTITHVANSVNNLASGASALTSTISSRVKTFAFALEDTSEKFDTKIRLTVNRFANECLLDEVEEFFDATGEVLTVEQLKDTALVDSIMFSAKYKELLEKKNKKNK